ncbi:MAG: hypothetical protein HY722_04065, partial [Planctomycetes bacterium]|nr:hypothetical protein [Planctomycetota bacterium]
MEGLINKERLACLAAVLVVALAALRALEGAARREPVPEVPPMLEATGEPPDTLPEVSFPPGAPAAGRDLFQRTEAWEPLAPAPLAPPS